MLGTSDTDLEEQDMSVWDCGLQLTEVQATALCQPATEMEVKQAAFSIDSSKSSGPDGFGSDFFKASWDIIKADLCNVVQDFFNHGQMLKEVNSALISLIPKNWT